MKEKRLKEIRLSDVEGLQLRNDEQTQKMIIEGYPIVFGKEKLIYDPQLKEEIYEKVDINAFANADMSDVILKYNHNDNVLILARTKHPKDKPQTLTLTVDDHGVFMHAELIDTTTNKDVYEMVKGGLLFEGSFAFTIVDKKEFRDVDGYIHRTIMSVGYLFDVAICPNGAYGELTEIYARAKLLENNLVDKVETLNRCAILKLKNKNKLKLMGGKKNG